MFELDKIVRENIKKMKSYSTARHEFSGAASVFLDANENAFGSPLPNNFNRYPDPLQFSLKEKVSNLKNISPGNIFLGNGSDESIDLLFRIFCEPGIDNVIICPPTYGIYEVCAEINNVKPQKINLTENYHLNINEIRNAIDEFTKTIFICSPNNPTGNCMNRHDIESLLNDFSGIVVVDEAYINYSKQKSFIDDIEKFPNLVVIQTFSKDWGLAALRLGMAFADKTIIHYFNKVKYPYNINVATQQLVSDALENSEKVNRWIQIILKQREWLSEKLKEMSFVMKIFHSDANFILVKMNDAKKVYDYLLSKRIIVRNRSNVILCEDCLRITIGTPEENQKLLNELKSFAG